jgi:pyruvate/oxaloacetate carboxyltransferase
LWQDALAWPATFAGENCRFLKLTVWAVARFDRCAEFCGEKPYQAEEQNYASQIRQGDKAVQARRHDT